MEQEETNPNTENFSEHVINSGKIKLKIIELNAKKLNRLQRGWKEKCIALTESLIEFYINEEDIQNPFEEPELSIPFEKSKIECIEQYKNKEHAVIQINTEDVQIMIEASNETEIEEWYRQLKELKNAVTIKALKVSADEVQDVIASRLIPMVQERENLIDSALVNSQTLMEESAKFERTCNDIKKKEKRPLLWKLRKAMRQCNPRLNGCVSKNAADTTSNASEGQCHIIV